jgi:hypothetical protein
VFTPNLSIKLFLIIVFIATSFEPLSTSGTGVGNHLIMLIEHCEVDSSGCGLLFVIRASSGRLDGCENLCNGFPLVDMLFPIIINGFDTLVNVLFFIE